MMLSSLIQPRTGVHQFGRLSPGSTPACVHRHKSLVIAPQIPPRNLRSDLSRQRARPNVELKRSDRQHRLNFPNTHADAKSP
jgi:hypothetical protein